LCEPLFNARQTGLDKQQAFGASRPLARVPAKVPSLNA
jgi:hypothetical protein